MFRLACEYFDGPEGRTASIAMLVIVAIGLVVLDAYARIERRRER